MPMAQGSRGRGSDLAGFPHSLEKDSVFDSPVLQEKGSVPDSPVLQEKSSVLQKPELTPWGALRGRQMELSYWKTAISIYYVKR